MSSGTNSTPHAVTWTWLLVLLGVPMLYFLSVPPLVCTVHYVPVTSTATSFPVQPPDWLIAYATPYEWFAENTPLRRPLEAYADWCFDTADR